MLFLYAFTISFCHCRLQPHADTRAKQIAAWKSLVLEYYRITKQAVVDVREAHTNPLFSNTNINSILLIHILIERHLFHIILLYIIYLYSIYFIYTILYITLYICSIQ